MKKAAKKRKLPLSAEKSRSRAAGMAATTHGRDRAFEDKTKRVPPARKDIDEQREDAAT